jgi:hypothetical protein
MKRVVTRFSGIILCFLFVSCATMFSRTSYNVRVQSVPVQAEVSIFDRKGNEMYSGKTPFQVNLKSSGGYFRRAIYTIEFNKPGFSRKTIVLRSEVNGWYYGNFFIGGLIGFLVVDPATGAMYTLKEKDIQAELKPRSTAGNDQGNAGLVITDITQLRAGVKPALKQVNP